MSLGSGTRARILLKARPTPRQLADRLRPPLPEGLELYLDGQDVATADARQAVIDRMRSYALPADFAVVVEGPIRGLDGEYFDLADLRPASFELLERLAELGAAVGATGLVIHAIVPRFALVWDAAERDEVFARCLTLLRAYVAAAQAHGLVPTLENVPPVLRMRESRYLYTPIGMSPEDMVRLLDATPGLHATLDVSHAQLYVNARQQAEAPSPPAPLPGGEGSTSSALPPWERAGGEGIPRGAGADPVETLYAYLRHLPPIASVETFVDALADRLFEVHVSNATGLLGEGLPYGEGDMDLDRLTARLSRLARYLITETLEPDHDVALFMREAQARLTAARAASAD
ncbi:MAG TPA: TIM barrel protein [Chloroflexota bacterium]|nr:TIM barrel protein [Chloroflexota bacterium]